MSSRFFSLLDLIEDPDLSAILTLARDKDPRGEKGFDRRMITLLPQGLSEALSRCRF